jgi:hypothetical protein
MNEKASGYSGHRLFGEGLIVGVSTGLFFILIGVIFLINQNLWPKIKDFGNDFIITHVANTSIQLPAPATPRSLPCSLFGSFSIRVRHWNFRNPCLSNASREWVSNKKNSTNRRKRGFLVRRRLYVKQPCKYEKHVSPK